MDVDDEMGLKMKRTRTNGPNKLGHLPQKTNDKKPRIINITDNNYINHDITSISDHINQTIRIEIEHLKNNGLIYSNISKFR